MCSNYTFQCLDARLMLHFSNGIKITMNTLHDMFKTVVSNSRQFSYFVANIARLVISGDCIISKNNISNVPSF